MKKITYSRLVEIPKRATLILLFILIFSSLIGQPVFWTSKDPPVVRYDLDITIDVSQDRITGNGTISFVNKSNAPITHIAIEWPQTGKYTLLVLQDGISIQPENPGNTSQEPILFKLRQEAGKNKKVAIQISFTKIGFLEGNTDRIYLAAQWYPKIWWDGIQSADHYLVALHYPEGYTVAATGSAKGQLKTYGKYEVGRARYFAVYLGKNQPFLTADVEGVKVTVVFPEEGKKVAETTFSILKEAIPFFVKKHGFFPFSYFNVIPGDSGGPWGGYNFAPGMAVIHGMEHFTKKHINFWKWITVHELCHHYWGEYVFDSNVPSWLWIGLGIYEDESFVDHIGLDYNKYAGFQRNYFTYGVKEHFDTTLDISEDYYEDLTSKLDWNNIVKHGKSYTVIKALESVIGAENMKTIMQKCLEEYQWKTMTDNDFQRIAETVSGQNLNWFFDQWVRSTKYLSVFVSDSASVPSENGFVSTVRLSNLGDLRMPVPVKVHFKDGSSQISKTDRISRNPVLTFTSQSELVRIELDPEHQLPVFRDTVYPSPEQLNKIISRLPYSDLGDDLFQPFELAKKINTPNSSTWFDLGIRFYDGGLLEQCRECFSRSAKLSEIAKDTSTVFASYSWLGLILDVLDKRTEALDCYHKALNTQSQGTFNFSQFNLTIDKHYIEERLQKPYQGIKRIFYLK